MKRFLLYPGTAGFDLFALLIAVVVRLGWGLSLRAAQGVVVVLLRPETLIKGAPAIAGPRWLGITLGHVIIVAVPSQRVLEHEHVHVEQFEAAGLLGLLVAVVVALVGWSPATSVIAVALWVLFPLATYGAGALAAWLRGEPFYRGNHLEEAAYDATDDEVLR